MLAIHTIFCYNKNIKLDKISFLAPHNNVVRKIVLLSNILPMFIKHNIKKSLDEADQYSW
jgi:hypothetical protein